MPEGGAKRREGGEAESTNMEPISAIDVFTHMKPAQATRYSQIKPAVPPLMSAIMEVLPPRLAGFAFMADGSQACLPQRRLPRCHENHRKAEDGHEAEISLARSISNASRPRTTLPRLRSAHTLISWIFPMRNISLWSSYVPFFSGEAFWLKSSSLSVLSWAAATRLSLAVLMST